MKEYVLRVRLSKDQREIMLAASGAVNRTAADWVRALIDLYGPMVIANATALAAAKAAASPKIDGPTVEAPAAADYTIDPALEAQLDALAEPETIAPPDLAPADEAAFEAFMSEAKTLP